MLLSVVALMMVMLAMSVALLSPSGVRSLVVNSETFGFSAGVTPEGPSIDGKRSEDGFICLSLTRGGPEFYDNRPVSPQ